MSHIDISRLWVLDLACMKHCGKQLPTLTLTVIFESLENLEEKRLKKKKPKPHGPSLDGTNDIFTTVAKGSRKKKWVPRREHRQCATQYRMKRALRIGYC